jgi:uncharacterized protein YbjT (DUF2867 family)
MTVLVTGASGVVGTAVVRSLLARDEVRATVRRPEAAEPLRALGAKVTVRTCATADDVAEVLPRCHTLVHLIGGVAQPSPEALVGANLDSVHVAIEAAQAAGTRRFVFVSVPGASSASAHPFLRLKGLAEEAVAAAGLEYAIVRLSHVYGLGGLWFTSVVHGALATPPFVCGPGSQDLAPVFAEDVGDAIAAIDDDAGPLNGTYGLEGPDVTTADDLVRLLRDDDAEPVHADGQPAAAVLTKLLETPVDAVTASFFAMPSRRDRPDASEWLGRAPTPLVEGLRRTLAAAAAVGEG